MTAQQIRKNFMKIRDMFPLLAQDVIETIRESLNLPVTSNKNRADVYSWQIESTIRRVTIRLYYDGRLIVYSQNRLSLEQQFLLVDGDKYLPVTEYDILNKGEIYYLADRCCLKKIIKDLKEFLLPGILINGSYVYHVGPPLVAMMYEADGWEGRSNVYNQNESEPDEISLKSLKNAFRWMRVWSVDGSCMHGYVLDYATKTVYYDKDEALEHLTKRVFPKRNLENYFNKFVKKRF